MRMYLSVALITVICSVAVAATRIEVTQGVKKFADGDNITITEVSSEKGTLADGDTITVKGTYTLASQKNASLLLSVTQNVTNKPITVTEQSKGYTHKAIKAGTGEYEMTIIIPYEGWIHLGFNSYSETWKPFGELYFGTKEQMDKIAHWDLEKRMNADVAATNNWNQKYNEWKALMENGENGKPKDETKAGEILTQLIKGVYLVKFGPADGFNPQTPGEYIPVFFQTSSLRSMDKDGRLGVGFLRTKRENNKLTASFLTDKPEQMKQDIEKNPKLVFVSMEEMTPDKFIAYDKSVQESLRNEPALGVTLGQFGKSIPAAERFRACENVSGAGFYWLDSTCAKLWWASPGKMQWEFIGQLENVKPAPVGTYMPIANKSGGGLYILNTTTGEGWWTNGKEWKALGKPE